MKLLYAIMCLAVIVLVCGCSNIGERQLTPAEDMSSEDVTGSPENTGIIYDDLSGEGWAGGLYMKWEGDEQKVAFVNGVPASIYEEEDIIEGSFEWRPYSDYEAWLESISEEDEYEDDGSQYIDK